MRRHSLAALLILPILLTGCKSFTLIGAVNLGMGDPQVQPATPSNPDETRQIPPTPACWPDSTAFKAEQRAHGYSKDTWTATAAFLAALAPVKAQHPGCP